MVHRPSRDNLARALRHYVAGLVTNDQLDELQVDWRDRGAVAIHERAWALYDDMYTHRATGDHQISREGRREIAKWILFLHSDLEYLWPEYSFMQIKNWLMNFLTLGWWERHKARTFTEFMQAGDFSVWPFISACDFQQSLSNPTLLVGRQR